MLTSIVQSINQFTLTIYHRSYDHVQWDEVGGAANGNVGPSRDIDMYSGQGLVSASGQGQGLGQQQKQSKQKSKKKEWID